MDKETPGYTYADLRRVHIGRLEEEQKSLQQIRNHTAALKSFMTAIGRSDQDFCLTDLKDAFDKNLNRFREYSASAGISAATIANRSSCLNAIAYSIAFLTFDTHANEDFANLLSKAMHSKTVNHIELGKQASVKSWYIKDWLAGIIPHQKSINGIKRIERALGIDGVLCAKLNVIWNIMNECEENERRVPFNEKMKKLCLEGYRKSDVSQQVIDEWKDMVNFYTSSYLLGGIRRNSTWRVKDDTATSRKMRWYGFAQNGYCVTAEIRWQFLLHSLGTFFNRLSTIQQ